MTEHEGFKYYAFISYSHADKKTAARLQRKLEHYHLPSALLKSHPELPKKLSPIFIDEANLIGRGTLKTALEANLDRSNYLILICSPSSARSPYVNDEVEYFINLGRADHIIPVIVGGEPHAKDPSQECFPPAILAFSREHELLGIDLRVHGVRDGFLRVIATLLQLDLDEFISREARERRKRAMIFTPLAAALSVLAGMLLWHNIPHSRYYRSYTYQWEKPVGLFEVKSESERKNLEYTYKFTTLRGRIQKIERVNSAGILVDPLFKTQLTELPLIKFISDTEVEHYDLSGHKIFRKQYTQNMRAVDFYCGDGDIPYTLQADMTAEYDIHNYESEYAVIANTGNIIRLTLDYDSDGCVVRKMFRHDNHGGSDSRGTPAIDAKGRGGLAYTLDSMGRVTELRYLNRDGEAMSVDGVWAEQIDYGDSPYPVKISCIDKDGRLTRGSRGWAYEAAAYDENFNIEKLSFFDADGKRSLNNDRVSEVVFTHDENGFVISESNFGTDLTPCLSTEGIFRAEISRSTEGRETEVNFYGLDGERVICSGGFAGYTVSYNRDGELETMSFHGTENEPVRNAQNKVYGIRWSYDGGLRTRVDYLDAQGNLMLNSNGYASETYSYDKDQNKNSTITYTDTEGRKVITSFGYAEVRYTFNDGNISTAENYDEHGNLILSSLGAARITYDWQDGRLMSMKFFDTEGRPVMNTEGYSRVDNAYNENGMRIWQLYYDTEGKRILPYRAVYKESDGQARLEVQSSDSAGSGEISLNLEPSDPQEQNELAKYYLYGQKGLKQDYAQALKWFRESAEQGHMGGMFNLSQMYEYGFGVERNPEQAFYWCSKAAEKGQFAAMYHLGRMYIRGFGTQKDRQTGIDWLRKSAELGLMEAQYDLGILLSSEQPEQSHYWHRKAAEQGNTDAQFFVGFDYYRGRKGVKVSYSDARFWFEQAASGGHVKALWFLGVMYSQGWGVDVKNPSKAAEYFRLAAEKGDNSSQSWLGDMYLNGDGVEQDYEQALYWYTKAAEGKNKFAVNNLAIMYRHGYGVPKNPEKAFELFMQAAELGSTAAQRSVGIAYEYGEGVEVDNVKAYMWYFVSHLGDPKRMSQNLENISGKLSAKQIRQAQQDAKNKFIEIVGRSED